MQLKLKNQKYFCTGFTLLEVLIASVIGMVLIEVILQNYLSAKHIYKTQNEIAHLSEDIRFAGFFLQQSITHAGFAGCRRISELNLTNNTNMSFTASDVIHGYDSNSAQIPLDLAEKIVPNTDVIVITKANSGITKITTDIDANLTSLKVEENPATKANLILLISDCKNGELLIADKPKNKTIKLKTPLTNSYNKVNTLVSRVEKIIFFISEVEYPTPKHVYSLYFSINNGRKEELIPGISNMKIVYGVDNKNLGKVTEYLKATEITNRNLWENVLSVVITLTPQNQLLALKQWQIYIKLRERS